MGECGDCRVLWCGELGHPPPPVLRGKDLELPSVRVNVAPGVAWRLVQSVWELDKKLCITLSSRARRPPMPTTRAQPNPSLHHHVTGRLFGIAYHTTLTAISPSFSTPTAHPRPRTMIEPRPRRRHRPLRDTLHMALLLPCRSSTKVERADQSARDVRRNPPCARTRSR